MKKNRSNFEKELRDWLAGHGRVVLAGIGNPIRRDDFVGVKIVQDLQGKLPTNVSLIECETVPESFMDEIAQFKPTHLLLIDAAVMGFKAGDVRLFDAEKVSSFPAISTHMLPLRVFCDYVTEISGAKIALLLVEPRDTEFGEGLTRVVGDAAEKVTMTLLALLGKD